MRRHLVQSIINAIKTFQEGKDDKAGHRMFGEGVGYTKEEIDEFINTPPDPLIGEREVDFKPYFRYEEV